ncbi:phosphomannomutase/phosphoglucomutase [Candidatus Riflebacteria bacterium]
MSAFKAYDIRGVYGKDLTDDLAYRVGYFLPKLLESDHVLVGRDARESSPAVLKAFCQGVNDRGCDVWDIGLCTTPTVYFAGPHLNSKASVMITASHNPREYNGIKISREDSKPVAKETGLPELEQLCKGEVKPQANKGTIIKHDIRKAYLKFLSKWQKPLTGLKVVFDTSNGMEGLYLEDIFGYSGAGCTFINLEIDGTFPNHAPNPLEPKNVVQLQEKVRETGADIGVIFDGDADRVMFVDEKGGFVSPDLIIPIMGRELLKDEKSPVSYDVRTSRSAIEEIRRLGGDPIICQVGHPYAKKLIRDRDAIFGGELAGHFYFRDNSYCDSGIIAALIVLGIVAKSEKSLSEMISEINKYHYSGEINFKAENKDELMEMVLNNYPGGKLNDLDGYRVDFEDWWYSIRKSNTEPYLRLTCEANTKQMMEQRVAEITKIIEDNRA